MQFRTELTPDKLAVQMHLTDRIVTVGSCFAEVMGGRLAGHKLTVLNNPLGTLFNPFSISNLLTLALDGNVPDEAGYVQRDGLWFHYDAHSSLWGHSREALADTLARRLTETGDALRRANWLLLTLGSAVVYQHTGTGQIVANCHKMPGTLFRKYLSPIEPVRSDLTELIRCLRTHNPGLHVVLTVSPVRHVRDGLTMNSASKSLLRLVCAELSDAHPNVHYFPAYELVQDDLRDYRFYEADLIHPNAQAHEYVFAKFAGSAFSPGLLAFVDQWGQIRRDMAHRPLHSSTDAHRAFLQKIIDKIDALPAGVDTSAERAELLTRLLIN